MKTIALLILGIGTLTSGCGGSRFVDSSSVPQTNPTPLEKEGSSLISAANLGLQVLPAETASPEVPVLGPLNDPESPFLHKTHEGLEVLLHGKLFIPDPKIENRKEKDIFFVLPENSLGSPLRNAMFSHRAYTPEKGWQGDLNPRSAWHDADQHRWFIPLSEIFRDRIAYGAYEAEMEDLQVVTLELTPETGSNQIFQIRFQAAGALPHIEPSAQQPPPVPGPAAFISTSSRTGWVVHQEEIKNPTQRNLALWVKALPETNLSFETYIVKHGFDDTKTRAPQPQDSQYRSVARFVIDQVSGAREDGTIETQPMTSEWVKFALGPSEKLILQWHASPGPLSKRCSLPSPVSELRSWPIEYWHYPPGTVAPGAQHTDHFTIQWALLGGQIKGNLNREIRVAHSFLSPKEATGEGDLFSTKADPKPLNLQIGNGARSLQLGGCQGIFP